MSTKLLLTSTGVKVIKTGSGIITDSSFIKDSKVGKKVIVELSYEVVGDAIEITSETAFFILKGKFQEEFEIPTEGKETTIQSEIGSSGATKPPPGLIPKKFHDEQVKADRFNEVCKAISRYYSAGLKINVEWIEEYNELTKDMNKRGKAEDKLVSELKGMNNFVMNEDQKRSVMKSNES